MELCCILITQFCTKSAELAADEETQTTYTPRKISKFFFPKNKLIVFSVGYTNRNTNVRTENR